MEFHTLRTPAAPAAPVTWTDRLIASLDQALKTLSGAVHPSRPAPRACGPSACGPSSGQYAEQSADAAGGVPAFDAPPLAEAQRRESGALMRVNHVGEVCAQALYQAQALTARTPALRRHMLQAAQEEQDHLAWTAQRLKELGSRPSLLNPLWYAGAFAMGLAAGRASDAFSLGFVVETERQVEQHLAGHLERLPASDAASRAIVEQMRRDEIRHGAAAQEAGAAEMPEPLRRMMRVAAKLMTTVAHRI